MVSRSVWISSASEDSFFSFFDAWEPVGRRGPQMYAGREVSAYHFLTAATAPGSNVSELNNRTPSLPSSVLWKTARRSITVLITNREEKVRTRGRREGH